MIHLVFSESFADSYRRAGYDVTEVRPGCWSVSNPRAVVDEKGKGRK